MKIFIKEVPDYLKNRIFINEEIELKPLTILTGPNSSGKSTLIQAIRNKKINIEIESTEPEFKCKHYSFTNSVDNQRNSKELNGPFFTEKFLDKYITIRLSEGQSNLLYCYDMLDLIKALQSRDEDSVIFIDEIDSGLSIDNQIFFMKKLVNLMKKDKSHKVFVIISSNCYEFCNLVKDNCLDIITGKYVSFNNYEEFRDCILNQKKFLTKLRGNYTRSNLRKAMNIELDISDWR